MAKSITECSDEELIEELERRVLVKTLKKTPPSPLSNPDFSILITLITEGIEIIIKEGKKEDSDFKYYIWQEAMEAVYGDKVWDWYNKLPRYK